MAYIFKKNRNQDSAGLTMAYPSEPNITGKWYLKGALLCKKPVVSMLADLISKRMCSHCCALLVKSNQSPSQRNPTVQHHQTSSTNNTGLYRQPAERQAQCGQQNVILDLENCDTPYTIPFPQPSRCVRNTGRKSFHVALLLKK